MRFGTQKAQNSAPADPDLQVQPGVSGAAVAATTRRRIKLPSIRLPGMYTMVIVLSVLVIALTLGVIGAITTGNSHLVTPLLAVDGSSALLAMVCCVIGAANGES